MERPSTKESREDKLVKNILPAMISLAVPVTLGKLASVVLRNPIPSLIGWAVGLFLGGKKLLTGK